MDFAESSIFFTASGVEMSGLGAPFFTATPTATLASGRERIANLTNALLPAADRRVQLAAAAYKAGTGSLADTFAAKRAQLDAELQVLDLQRDVSQTWAQLEYQVVPASMSVSQ